MTAPCPDCGLYIKWISEALAAQANRNLKAHNLTISQCHVLMTLFRCDHHCAALKELETLLDVSQPTMVGLVARLEQKGLIISCADPHDRRIKRVQLTPEGLCICHASRQEILDNEARLVAPLTPKEQEQFLDMLQRIYQSLRP